MSAPDRWRSPDGDRNAQALQQDHPALYDAIAGFDALGHRVLARVETGPTITQDRELVAIALRRPGRSWSHPDLLLGVSAGVDR